MNNASLLFLTSALGFACGGTTAQPTTPAPAGLQGEPVALQQAPFWQPGESMRWQISIHGVVAAAGQMVVGQPQGSGEQARIVVQTQARSAGALAWLGEARQDTSTEIALRTGQPVRRINVETRDQKWRRWDSVYEPGKLTVTPSRMVGKPAPPRSIQFPSDAHIHDPIAAMGMLRGWRGQRGEQAFLHVYTDRLMRHVVRSRGVELVTVPEGTFSAVRLDVKAFAVDSELRVGARIPDEDYSIWFAADATRRPLVMQTPHQLGRVHLEMEQYTRPGRRRPR